MRSGLGRAPPDATTGPVGAPVGEPPGGSTEMAMVAPCWSSRRVHRRAACASVSTPPHRPERARLAAWRDDPKLVRMARVRRHGAGHGKHQPLRSRDPSSRRPSSLADRCRASPASARPRGCSTWSRRGRRRQRLTAMKIARHAASARHRPRRSARHRMHAAAQLDDIPIIRRRSQVPLDLRTTQPQAAPPPRPRPALARGAHDQRATCSRKPVSARASAARAEARHRRARRAHIRRRASLPRRACCGRRSSFQAPAEPLQAAPDPALHRPQRHPSRSASSG